jgi:hypothetical protein
MMHLHSTLNFLISKGFYEALIPAYVTHAVYVPEDVKVKMVLLPDVVTVGEPVVVPE